MQAVAWYRARRLAAKCLQTAYIRVCIHTDLQAGIADPVLYLHALHAISCIITNTHLYLLQHHIYITYPSQAGTPKALLSQALHMQQP